MIKKTKQFVAMAGIIAYFTGCGGGGTTAPGGSNAGNIGNVIVDPQAYYMDIENGNDANDGKTPQTAWKSLAKLNGITINAGNKILFRAGEKWTGQLEIKNNGTVENPITISAYGTGAQPILTAVGTVNIQENNNNNKIDDFEWIPYTAVGDGIGLGVKFKEDVPDPAHTWIAVMLDDNPERVKINGQEMVGAFDASELGNTFKWYYNNDKPGTVFYYYGDNKPSSIETNLYSAPLYIHDNANVIVDNITLEGGYVAAIFIENASNISIKNAYIGNMSKQGIYVKAVKSTVSNITINNCMIDSHYALDYSMAQPNLKKNGRTTTTRGAPEGIFFLGGVQNSVISQNTLKNWTHASINLSADNKEELANNKIYNNLITAPDIAYGGRIGLDGENAHDNEFYENVIDNIKTSIQFNGHDNSFHDNTVQNIFESPLKRAETGYGIVVQAYTSPVYNNSIINNIFKNIAKDPIFISDINNYNVSNITTQPNTFQ